METLIEQFISIPGMIGWAIALGMIGLYIFQVTRLSDRMVDMAKEANETMAALYTAQAERHKQHGDIVGALGRLTTIVDERLPRSNGR